VTKSPASTNPQNTLSKKKPDNGIDTWLLTILRHHRISSQTQSSYFDFAIQVQQKTQTSMFFNVYYVEKIFLRLKRVDKEFSSPHRSSHVLDMCWITLCRGACAASVVARRHTSRHSRSTKRGKLTGYFCMAVKSHCVWIDLVGIAIIREKNRNISRFSCVK